MEQNPVVGKYTRAKIEEPNSILPDFLQNIYGGYISADDLTFKEVFASEDADASGVETDRKVYRIRKKDLFATFGENCEKMKNIQITSKAKIAVLADAESDNQNHSYMDLVGTVDQVRTAEHLILNKILKTYDSLIFPVILMPPIIHEEHVTIPLNKVGCFIGPNGSNLVKLEMETRTWMLIDSGPHSSSELDRLVKVYGPREHVIIALSVIQSEIHKPGEYSEAEKETEELFKKLQSGEKTDSKTSGGASERKKGKKRIRVEEAAQIEKYKAKIEDPIQLEDLTQLLPKSLLKVNMDPTTGELYYWRIFEDDDHKAQQLDEAVSAREIAEGKIYRIRNKELFKALGENGKHFEHIHEVSKCTIGLLSDGPSNVSCQSLIHLMGTVDQVRTAEHLILDKILQTYGPTFPVILTPPTISEHKRKLPLDKIQRLFGDEDSDILPMEIVSGAWIEFDTCHDCSEMERMLHIFGPKPQLVKALSLINSAIYEPGESADAKSELDKLYNELTVDEKEHYNKSRFREEFDKLAQEAKHKGANKEAASGSSYSSGQIKKQKQQHAEEKQQDVEAGVCPGASESAEAAHKGNAAA